MPLASDGVEFADDGIGPTLSFGHLNTLALDHLGGSPDGNDVAVFVWLPPFGAAYSAPGRDGKSTRPRCSPRYQRFESAFLQRRVSCEPGFVDQATDGEGADLVVNASTLISDDRCSARR
jgi:hypothetical protein